MTWIKLINFLIPWHSGGAKSKFTQLGRKAPDSTKRTTTPGNWEDEAKTGDRLCFATVFLSGGTSNGNIFIAKFSILAPRIFQYLYQQSFKYLQSLAYDLLRRI
jgi:hypothetical protein